MIHTVLQPAMLVKSLFYSLAYGLGFRLGLAVRSNYTALFDLCQAFYLLAVLDLGFRLA